LQTLRDLPELELAVGNASKETEATQN
jgi:hypothetical protein